MPDKRILILGGTGLAREAADALIATGAKVVSSLAGVTRHPHVPGGEIRWGGFGGVAGLADYLRSGKFELVVDATHAFAAQMSAHAEEACRAVDCRLVRLQAPVWLPQPGDDWRNVASAPEAVRALPHGAKVAVTIGRKEIGRFFARPDLSGIARMIEAPPMPAPESWLLLLERPPFSLAAEIDLLRANGIGFLVSKNAGGARAAKLDAAAALGLPVIMVARPLKPDVPTVAQVADLLGICGDAD